MATVSKRIKLIDCEPSYECSLINWDLCILCQKHTNVKLQCPNNSKRNDLGAGYTTFASTFTSFMDANVVPDWVRFKLDEGVDIVETLTGNNAKWHKSCRDSMNATKLLRKQKVLESQENLLVPTSSVQDQNIVSNRLCSTRSSFSTTSEFDIPCCFFCDKPTTLNDELHAAQTKNIDERVRYCALTLLDECLLAKLSTSDMTALDAKYHSRCLVNLYNRMREKTDTESAENASDQTDANSHMHGIAFAQLAAYIEEMKLDAVTLPVFKLSKLAELYEKRLTQLGLSVVNRINTTKLKNRLLSYFPDMRAQRCGKQVLLAFDEDIGSAMSVACQQRFDEDAVYLAKAANIVRRDLFNSTFRFNGSFSESCQQNAVPSNLVLLIDMILEGPSIDCQSNDIPKQATLSIAQIVKYNSVKHVRQSDISHVRHNTNQETPLPLYLSFLFHGTERSRNLVDKLFSLGLCVSYDRLLQLSAALGNSVSDKFDLANGPCPPGMAVGVFTTAAFDNIDHNPSSNTSVDAFHGSAISLTQHHAGEIAGNTVDHGPFEVSTSSRVKPLPQSYTIVPPAALSSKHPAVPELNCEFHHPVTAVERDLCGEKSWLEKVYSSVQDGLETKYDVSWAAFHASRNANVSYNAATSRLLPLFREASHSVAMIRHAMNIVINATDHLNHGQTPVLTVDQPLFALGKQVQWNWPNLYGESKLVLMLGGLHIEMAALKVIGSWLEGSGWTSVLVQAGVTTPGTADSMLRAAHVKRTRHMHEVTAASLYLLQQRAYQSYVDECDASCNMLEFTEWCNQMSEKHPQFQYWDMTLHLEVIVLRLIRSIRLADFDLYVDALSCLAPWFFTMDHSNYARWVSVHLRDMRALLHLHPNISKEFRLGKFTVNKTKRAFFAIALDQAHEQLNALVKSNGGAIGLTENPVALLRWMVSGPEVAHLISQFDCILKSETESTDSTQLPHHEQRDRVQSTFMQHVNAVVHDFMEKGNPFCDAGTDLYAVDTMVVVDKSVASSLKNIALNGLDQYNSFVNDCLVLRLKPMEDPIKRNYLAPFSKPRVRAKKDKKMSAVKSDCTLFSRLYIGCQTREGDLTEFFKHENHAFPPSLSDNGQLRFGKKADLLPCLETENVSTATMPIIDCIVLDGAAIVQMLNPGKSKTFNDYAHSVFMPYIQSQIKTTSRLDLVWDQYWVSSLKTATRIKRGAGCRKHVASTTLLPRNWQDFLHVNENKTELFSFLSNFVVENWHHEAKQVVVTEGCNVLSSPPLSTIDSLMPCTQEEADTRMFLHVFDAGKRGVRKAMIRTVDTDVIVLAIAQWESLNLDELWIAFGVGDKFRYIAVHKVVTVLGSTRSKALPFYHALTGCDTTSCFLGHGKKGSWETWNAFPAISSAFLQLSSKPTISCLDECMPLIERFVILMYDRTSEKDSVDSVRKQLFAKKGRQMEYLPPSKAALIEHVKRACFQAGHCWGSALETSPKLPCPSLWGWQKLEDSWEPSWTSLSPVSACCPELISCKCKKGCTKRCKCKKACLPCTALCYCDGTCRE